MECGYKPPYTGAALHPFRFTKSFHGAVAQLVEQRCEEPCVPGSIPGRSTMLRHKDLAYLPCGTVIEQYHTDTKVSWYIEILENNKCKFIEIIKNGRHIEYQGSTLSINRLRRDNVEYYDHGLKDNLNDDRRIL